MWPKYKVTNSACAFGRFRSTISLLMPVASQVSGRCNPSLDSMLVPNLVRNVWILPPNWLFVFLKTRHSFGLVIVDVSLAQPKTSSNPSKF